MERNTGTIFKVYLLAKQPSPPKQEGFIQLWKHKGKLMGVKNVPFNYPDEIPRKIRQELKAAKINWPSQKGTKRKAAP